jgi:outer membrane lipoprotein-sorting protein
MSVMTSRPVLRWGVPAGLVVVVLGGGALVTTMQASADVRLPPRSAAQLLVDLQTARLDGLSGTVVERADLGLPGLPAGLAGAAGAGPAGLDLGSLINGTNTARVWYSGEDKARIALTRSNGESDIVHNGTDTWIWNSKDNSAVHYKETAGAKPHPDVTPSDLPRTPQEMADQVLKAVDPTTEVTTDSNEIVAKHKVYTLVLRPRDKASLVAEVRFAIDGTAHLPMRVQVFAKGSPDKAAFEIGFTQVSFKRPDNGVFAFNPPPGAKVTEGDKDHPVGPDGTLVKPDGSVMPDRGAKPVTPGKAPADEPKSVVLGQGWTAVLVTKMPQPATTPKTGTDQARAGIDALLGRLPQVHGAFGTGRVLESKLFTALLLDDGRVLVGAVTQDRLIAAANDPAAALK